MKNFFGTSLVIGLVISGIAAQAAFNLGNLPLCFEANRGQNAAASFIAHGQDAEFLLSATGAQFVLQKASGETATARMQFVGANPAAQISGDKELPGKVNYLVGNNPAQWQSGVPTFGQVRIDGVYPGVSVVYYGNGRQLEYDFYLAAGVDPRTIALRFDGAKKIVVNDRGELVVSLNGGEMVQHQPVAYQTVRGARQEVTAGYKILDAHTVSFLVGNYDRSQPLVIDPILSYATFFGGNSVAIAHAVAVDGSGNIYLAGSTFSTVLNNGIPFATPGAFQTNFNAASGYQDVFVAKFDQTGTNLIYFTYLGGSQDQLASGLAVDAAGNAYVTGSTSSSDFPTSKAIFGTIGGQPFHGHYPPDAFVSELNSNGTALIYSTYLGGNNWDLANAIAVDASGAAYIAGYSSSANLPVTTNAFRSHLACPNNGIPNIYNFNAFVAKIAPGGTNLGYCSYLGGINYDIATGIAVDANGYVYITGYTASTNFPTTNALPNLGYLNGSTNATSAFDAFATKFKPGFAGLVYSTFLGGVNNDEATQIACDNAGNAYVTGWTISTNFPGTTTNDSFSAANIIANTLTNNLVVTTNAFLTEINSNGTAIMHSAVFGGSVGDVGNGVALDGTGNIFVVGTTASTNFPVSSTGSLSTTNSGGSDVFITAFKADWSGLLYSTYVGGFANDSGNAIAVDTIGNAYITGQTTSTNFAQLTTQGGVTQTFLAKISSDIVPKLLLVPQFVNSSLTTKVASGTPTTPSTSGLLLKWQKTPSVYVLESTTNPLLAAGWHTVSQTPQFTNNWYNLTLSPTNQSLFFRLHKQQ